MNSHQKQDVLAKLESLKELVGRLAGLSGGAIQKSAEPGHYLDLAAFVRALKGVKVDLAGGMKPSAGGVRDALQLARKAGASVATLPTSFRVAWRDYDRVGPAIAARLEEQVKKLLSGGAMARASALSHSVSELLSLVDHRDLAAVGTAAALLDDEGDIDMAKVEGEYAETVSEIQRLNENGATQQDRRRVEAEERLLKLGALRKAKHPTG